MSNLTLRILSALVLAPVVLGAVFLGGYYFTALMILVAVLMFTEWYKLCGINDSVGLFLSIILGVPSLYLVMAGEVRAAFILFLLSAAVVQGVLFWRGYGRSWALTGHAYILLPCIALIMIREFPGDGLMIILWVLFSVWATDIGAYAAGRLIGGPKLLPKISPKKTWAGLAGGALCSAAVSAYMFSEYFQAPWWLGAEIGVVVTVIAQTGDFWESWVKRRFGVKDSGNIIPGHGGLFDRLDGVLAVAPPVAVMLVLPQMIV